MPPPLEPGAIHVWRIDLDPSDARLDERSRSLSADERARADRFRLPLLRRRFAAGRGALRAVLAGYLGVGAGDVAFAYGDHGKPRLARDSGGVEFNLAHSHGVGLCAVTAARAVGVDVEQIRPIGEAGRIIGRYFTPAEQAEYLGHPEPERDEAFFRGWTRKEAFLKATGKGIAGGLDSFEVALGVSGPLLRRVGGDPDEAGRWSLLDVDAGPGFLGVSPCPAESRA